LQLSHAAESKEQHGGTLVLAESYGSTQGAARASDAVEADTGCSRGMGRFR